MTNKQQFTSWGQALTRLMRLSVMAILLALACGEASAQSITVKGVVKDSHGEAIVGASVVPQRNATTGTITDINGDFTLKATPNDTIVVTYIGFKTYKFVARANRLQNVVLSYQLPRSLVNGWKLSNASVSLIADNLLAYSPYSGSDHNSYKTLMNGYPLERTFTLSLNVGF